MDLAFFVTDYCEWPINQDLDPCSRVYEPELHDELCSLFLRNARILQWSQQEPVIGL